MELRSAAEERDRLLNDANYSSLQNDEAVTQARQERDEAMERKKVLEVGKVLKIDAKVRGGTYGALKRNI